MTMDRRGLMLAPLAFGLCGFSMQPMSPQLQQQWNGGHPESLDPMWNLLSAAPVQTDRQSGLLTVAFSEDVKRLAGKPLKIEGFMLPLTPERQTLQFALTRRNSGCPFCPPSKPTEAVQVLMSKLIKLTSDLVTVEGELVLHSSSDQGMFYELRRAVAV